MLLIDFLYLCRGNGTIMQGQLFNLIIDRDNYTEPVIGLSHGIRQDFYTPLPLGGEELNDLAADTLFRVTHGRPSFREIPGNLTLHRYKLWKEEQTLLVDSGRYIKPRTEINLTATGVSAQALVLPSRPVSHYSADWFAGFVFLSLLLFAVVKASYGKYLVLLFQSIFNYHSAHRLFIDQNISLKWGTAFLEVLYFLVFALFGFQVMKHVNISIPYHDFIKLMISLGLIIVFINLKSVLYSILGFISESQPITGEYLFNVKIHSMVLGILLLPVVLLTAYTPVKDPRITIIAGVIIILLMYLKMILRGIQILFKKQVSIFYLFLYLCILEFLPLLLLIKVI